MYWSCREKIFGLQAVSFVGRLCLFWSARYPSFHSIHEGKGSDPSLGSIYTQ